MQRVTTVIPVYNGERFLAETLESVARQTRRPDRLIVLDNCSTDGTKKIVDAFKEMPCEWRQNEKNLGLFGNCNRALEFAAETEYLHILHADDLLKPEFYEQLLKPLGDSRGRALLYCQCEFIDEQSRLIGPDRQSAQAGTVQVVPLGSFLAARTELRPFYFPTVLLKTDALPSTCRFRLDMPQLADLVFWAEWASHCSEVLESPRLLCQYRVHASNDTSRNLSSLQAWVLDEWKAMQLNAVWLRETGFKGWLRRQKLKCIFAARSHMKIQLVQKNSPGFANEIRQSTRTIAGAVPWVLGKLAVGLRDFLHYSHKK